MHNVIGNLIARVPNVSGKSCVEHVVGLRTVRGQNTPNSDTKIKATNDLWINGPLTIVLYTNCIRLIDSLHSSFVSVTSKFYTLYTAPTNITTTIN